MIQDTSFSQSSCYRAFFSYVVDEEDKEEDEDEEQEVEDSGKWRVYQISIWPTEVFQVGLWDRFFNARNSG